MAVVRKSRGDQTITRYLMKASTVITAGNLVMIDSAGLALVAAASASNKGCVGVATSTVTSAASGSYYIDVAQGDFLVDATSIAQTAVMGLVYASAAATVDETQGSNEPIAGMLIEYVSSTSGWVRVGPQFLT